MKLSKIRINNLFGIKEVVLSGKDYEIIGDNKAGKTSIIEAIRYALKNKALKEVVLRKGEEEGEILLETDTGISIHRRERTGKASIDTVKEGRTPVPKKESFLRGLFSDIQLNPVEFIALDPKEQNRIILDMIDFDWDLNWIKEQFGEIVPEVNYEQNILKVLHDIQSEAGYYYRTRQEINREVRNKKDHIERIAKSLPENYRGEEWEKRQVSDLYMRIERIQTQNRAIEKAKHIVETQTEKMRSFEADRDLALGALDREITARRGTLQRHIDKLKNELKEAEKELTDLEDTKAGKVKEITLQYEKDVAEFSTLLKENKETSELEIEDALPLMEEAKQVEDMKALVPEYRRMKTYDEEVVRLIADGEALTTKIEKARALPGEILQKTKLPLENLTISEEGVPLINGLPISNLSEGEKLDLCVDIASQQENALNLLLIDGVEKLSAGNRKKLYARCKERGIQFIATRTDDTPELVVVEV